MVTAGFSINQVNAVVDNFLFSFGSFGSGLGQFNQPTGVAIDIAGNVYVVDSGNNRIEKFTSSGTFISSFGSFGSGLFNQPVALAFDSSGNMYITEWKNHMIHVYASSGTFIQNFGGYGSGDGNFVFPSYLAFDSSGNLYISDQVNHRVQVYGSPNSSPDCSGATPSQTMLGLQITRG